MRFRLTNKPVRRCFKLKTFMASYPSNGIALSSNYLLVANNKDEVFAYFAIDRPPESVVEIFDLQDFKFKSFMASPSYLINKLQLTSPQVLAYRHGVSDWSLWYDLDKVMAKL